MGKGILEMPPATVILTANTTWSAALISRESALQVRSESWASSVKPVVRPFTCFGTLCSSVPPPSTSVQVPVPSLA